MPTNPPITHHFAFLFAHPDDEFACFESIRRVTASGGRAVCFYMTDGGYGGQLVEPRQAETRSALAELGVSSQDIHFLGATHAIRDGSLPQNLCLARACLLESLETYPAFEDIYAPAWEGGHQDHDATHLIALSICGTPSIRGVVWQFSLYHGACLPLIFFHVMKPLDSNGEVIKQVMGIRLRLKYSRLCLGYPSQWKTWIGLFPFVAFKLVCLGYYAVQPASATRITKRPHDGKLLYERRGALSWNTFHELSAEFLRSVTIDGTNQAVTPQ